jgi:hypothetical protein
MYHQKQLPRNVSHTVKALKAIAMGTFPPGEYIIALINENAAQQHSGKATFRQ